MEIILWAGFVVLILALLALDLGVLNRKAHVIKAKEALLWTAFWVFLSLIFNVVIYFMYQHHWLGIGEHVGSEVSGGDAALKFFTGYLIEKSLSLDNIFVIALIFSYFDVPAIYQHRVLFWGILGALVMRGIMIIGGVALIQKFVWMVYVFGGLLIITSIRMLFSRHDKMEPEKNPVVKFARRLFPVSAGFQGKHFFIRVDGKIAMTPLFLVLLVIESTDVLFAIDSIPAIFAITYDPFIVFTSNVFAILGLRSLYFALAAIIEKFKYVKLSLVIILAYVGIKMILTHHYKIPTHISLIVICVLLLAGILASLIVSRREEKKVDASIADQHKSNKK